MALLWVWGGDGYSDDTQAVLSGLQTDAVDNHRSFHERHGLAGKRELQPEDGATAGEGLPPGAPSCSTVLHVLGAQGGGLNQARPPLSTAGNRSSET